MDTADIQAKDHAHYMHPFTDHKALGEKGVRVMVRGEGIYLWDSEGRKMLDGMSGLWCVNVGYGRKSIAQVVYEQMETLAFYNSFFNTTNLPAVQLAEKLAQLAPPGFSRVFFTGSGSEANDTNVRMVRRYWDLQGQPQRDVIISRKNAYHGSTMAGASLGGMDGMHAQGGLPIPGIVHIGQPNYLESGKGKTEDEFGIEAASWLEQKILELGPERVAAFIGEPIQGAGGVVIPPSTYWPEIQRICDKYGVLLIADEVITGFGRTGRMFASELFGMKPDLITFAKGVTSGYVPLGGVLVGDRVADVLIAQGGELAHGFTYSGHPVACAVAVANIKLMQRERIVERVAEDTGPYLRKRFLELGDHPLVAEPQTCGMTAGLVLVRSKSHNEYVPFDAQEGVGMVCRRHCFEGGIIMRAVGDRMIIAPPLVMSHAEIDLMCSRIRGALDRTADELRRLGKL